MIDAVLRVLGVLMPIVDDLCALPAAMLPAVGVGLIAFWAWDELKAGRPAR